MTDLQPTLDAIDRALAQCDASVLPPLGCMPPDPVTIAAPSAAEFADGLRALATLGQSVNYPAPTPPDQPAEDPNRGWLARWIRRTRR